jgi:hypothetical protein
MATVPLIAWRWKCSSPCSFHTSSRPGREPSPWKHSLNLELWRLGTTIPVRPTLLVGRDHFCAEAVGLGAALALQALVATEADRLEPL